MELRLFQKKDAAYCFKLRSSAFIQKFHGELTPQEVAAAVNSYMPEDYIRMAKEKTFFIVEQNGVPIIKPFCRCYGKLRWQPCEQKGEG